MTQCDMEQERLAVYRIDMRAENDAMVFRNRLMGMRLAMQSTDDGERVFASGPETEEQRPR